MAAKENSFDIVSKIDLSAVQNAVNTAMKEIKTRYDFKGTKSDITLDKDKSELIMVSDNDFKMDQLKDVLLSKLIKQEVPTKNFEYGKSQPASGGTVRQIAKMVSGIDKDNAKKITTRIKESGLKVKSNIQEDQVRVTGKSKDDLQKVMALVKQAELSVDVQFINFR